MFHGVHIKSTYSNTWWTFLKMWNQMKRALFSSLFLRGNLQHPSRRKQEKLGNIGVWFSSNLMWFIISGKQMFVKASISLNSPSFLVGWILQSIGWVSANPPESNLFNTWNKVFYKQIVASLPWWEDIGKHIGNQLGMLGIQGFQSHKSIAHQLNIRNSQPPPLIATKSS